MLRRKGSAPKVKARAESSASASALFPPPAERERLDDLLTRELIDADRRVADR